MTSFKIKNDSVDYCPLLTLNARAHWHFLLAERFSNGLLPEHCLISSAWNV